MDRRDFIKTTSAAAALTGARTLLSASSAQRQPDLIKVENARPGASFQLTRMMPDNAKSCRTSMIEGYCSRQSVKAGEKLDIFVSTRPASKFIIDLFRMGYYDGAGSRLMTTLGPFTGKDQPVPEMGDNRLRECQWEVSTTLTIPAGWPSGVYLGRLTTVPPEGGTPKPYWQSYIIFIVKDDRPADILFQCSDNTWQAYNQWPVKESLYTDPRAAHAPGVSVSFDRPYGKYVQIFDNPLSMGSGEFLLWEFPLCYWLEKEGYDVTYCSNVDNLDSANLARVKTMISIGHDEYWDLRQYQNVKQAIADGLSVLWLSANDVYMVTPFTPNAKGDANRRLTRETCYGEFREEEKAAYSKVLGPFENPGPDERDIIGARTIVPFNGGGDWTCAKPDHWLFEGTGMKQGDSIPGLVGWEFHGDPDTAREGLEVIAAGNVWSGGSRLGKYAATVFEGPKQNIVFNATTIFWSQGLSDPPGHMIPWSHYSRPHGPDERVQRITRNALKRAIG
ncbi:MAG: N,N-dimethylformamidase beta subunit family domain-containing protein [Prosthecobacter sp.]|uniref:N,N-dimethylformamidase beta subunit family domain-containing protein n=1 Tax=Prosthecobacter sp. TaxID=1965333 RepID=UPI0039012766